MRWLVAVCLAGAVYAQDVQLTALRGTLVKLRGHDPKQMFENPAAVGVELMRAICGRSPSPIMTSGKANQRPPSTR